MKRISVCFFCVLFVFMLAFSASAAELEYFPTVDSNGMYLDASIPLGYYQACAYASDGTVIFSGAFNLDLSDEYSGFPATFVTVPMYSLRNGVFEAWPGYDLKFGFVLFEDGRIKVDFGFPNGRPSELYGLDLVGFSLRPSEPESHLMDSVSDNLNVVVSWVGNVVDSLTDGPLFPLLAMLALPISISALFVGIKALKKSSWGV